MHLKDVTFFILVGDIMKYQAKRTEASLHQNPFPSATVSSASEIKSQPSDRWPFGPIFEGRRRGRWR